MTRQTEFSAETAPRDRTFDGTVGSMWPVEQAIYAKPFAIDGRVAYAVFAADGTYLDTAETMAEVLVTANRHDLLVATLH
ncbi:MAG: hypothetical protein KDE22_12615 [Rhodobacterales bacterium]|nr:hypothetical protein [Rhodobacterales bacterium]